MAIRNAEALQARAHQLADAGLNGLKLVLVDLDVAAYPGEARLQVFFYTDQGLDTLVSQFETAPPADQPAVARQLFPLSGGQRLPAGSATGQVQVRAIAATADPTRLELTIAPIGDYAPYTLSVNAANIDPIFSELIFKFRPGCFGTDCAPGWDPAPPSPDNPTIDYLAKDYDSFRHTLMVAMMERVPGWRPTSEADLDQVLLSVFSAAADELSDYQDRVMNEAYLSTARKRVSLARLARLMDYHIHQGNQASTWLALKLSPGASLPLPQANPVPGGEPIQLQVWAGHESQADEQAVVFLSRATPGNAQTLDSRLNQLGLYTWSESIPTLAAGSTTADLQVLQALPDPDTYSPLLDPLLEASAAQAVADQIQTGAVTHLLIQEWLNPATGNRPGRNPEKRQLLRLLPTAIARQDPLTGAWLVQVAWQAQDALQTNYCFTVDCPEGKREHISLFHGNLVTVFQGRPRNIVFKSPDAELGANEYAYEPTRWGTLCRLPDGPLAYQETPPGGDVPPRSTLAVTVSVDGLADPWDEVINLIHSDDSSENGDRFMVETDELGQSWLRFGNDVNGRQLPPGAEVFCTYQVGQGPAGNVGADQVRYVDTTFPFGQITACWNPFDVTNGRAPEVVTDILRRVPEAYQFHQLRAVTLKDYVDRAEALPGVAKAAARYAWTGSWRTVQVTIDPLGTTELTADLRQAIAQQLNAVRLIGEDIEIRPPRFVPLEIEVALCIHPDYWPEDIQFWLEQEFSEGYTADGRLGFFHPDRWTFGQPLWASEIGGRIHQIAGIDHVIAISIKRWHEANPGTEAMATVRPNEILRVRNDPNHPEDGVIRFEIRGGRQ